jgi:hypothetical protein
VVSALYTELHHARVLLRALAVLIREVISSISAPKNSPNRCDPKRSCPQAFGVLPVCNGQPRCGEAAADFDAFKTQP